MNTDRFLTRVFDRQENKMLYFGDVINNNCASDFISKFHENFILIGINNDCLTVKANGKEYPFGISIYSIALGKRFIPMQCEGIQDTENKLIYESDIVKDPCGGLAIVKYYKRQGNLEIIPILDIDNKLIHRSLPNKTAYYEIVGNIHQNPELLEQNK